MVSKFPILFSVLLLAHLSQGQPLFPEHFKKLGSASITGLPDEGLFGTSVTSIGDLDGDGFTEIAVGSRDDGGVYNGGLRLFFLDGNNDVKSFVKVPSLGPAGTVFGYSVRDIGDLDGDGIVDLAVGAPYDGDGGAQYGAVYILFLNTDGTVKSSQKISSLHGGFSETLTTLSSFGSAIANLGDLDNDGNVDIAVGAYRDNGGTSKTGSVYVLFLNSNGTVKESTKISGNIGGLAAPLSFEGYFGVGVTGIGDLDNDGVVDMAVGSHRWDAGAEDAGSVWILFMNTDGTVKSHHRIDNSSGDIPEHIDSGDLFGTSVEYANDIDGDGVEDILAGALGDGDQGPNSGALWVLLMNENGTVANAFKVNGTHGNTDITLSAGDYFGTSVAYLGIKDGLLNLAIGAIRADEGGPDRGVVWIPGVAVCPELTANAGLDQIYCDGRTAITLDAVSVEKGTGHWSVLHGNGQVVHQYDPQSTASNLEAGEHTFVWTVSFSQECPAKADEVKVIIERLPYAGEDLFPCDGGTTNLNASDAGLGNGFWEITSGNVGFSDANDPQTEIEIHADANLKWTVQSPHCPDASDEIYIDVQRSEPDAGQDRVLCDGRTQIDLNAVAPQEGTGRWRVLFGNAQLDNPDDPRTTVYNLGIGEHLFAWSISGGNCPVESDTIRVTAQRPPSAGEDTVLCKGRSVILNASDAGWGGYWEIISGGATLSDVNDPNAEAVIHSDSVRLKWTMQSQYCPEASDEIKVRVWEIRQEDFYNVITPGDIVKMNEVWIVEDLSELPGQKTLKIFNRWGNLVYAVQDYKNDWNANGLAAGEYYYHMTLPACRIDFKGWIHVIK